MVWLKKIVFQIIYVLYNWILSYSNALKNLYYWNIIAAWHSKELRDTYSDMED